MSRGAKTEARILVETSRELPLVDFEVAIPTGALFDPEGLDGAFRLLARTMRKGSASLTSAEVEEGVASLGARMSIGVSSGSFRVQGTVIKKNIEPLVKLMAELLLRPALRAKDFAQVKRETKAELVAARDDDRSLAGRAFRGFLFGDHPYGRLTVGTLGSLGRVRREHIVELHGQIVVAGNLVFGASGDIRRSEVNRLVERYFGDLPAGKAPTRKIATPKIPRGRRVLLVDKPERTQTQIYIGTLGTHHRDPLLFPLMVGDVAFGGTFSAKLMHEVRSVRGWSYGAYSRLTPDKKRDAWYMWTHPAATDAAACVSLQLELLDEWVAGGLSDDDVRFAKKYLVNSHCFEVDTAIKRLDAKLDIELFDLPPEHHRQFVQRVRAVKPDEARDAVRRRISPRDLAIVVVGTASELRASLEALPGVVDLTVVPYDKI